MSFIPKITEPETNWPFSLGIFGVPKIGKTTVVADLTVNFLPGESVIMCLDEQNPYKQVKSSYVEFDKLSKAHEWLNQIIKSGEKIKMLIVDHMTKVDEWSEMYATVKYMHSVQGKKFNRDPNGKVLPVEDWQTVWDIGQGHGYRFSRQAVMEFKAKCHEAAEHVIFLGHLKDKEITNVEGQTLRIEKKLALTGKLSSMFPAYINGIAHMYADGNQRFLDFEASKKSVLGATLKHLNGQILISESNEEGEVTVYWDKIFPPQHTKK